MPRACRGAPAAGIRARRRVAAGRRVRGPVDAGRGVAAIARREVDAPARLRAEGRREVRDPVRGQHPAAADDAAQRLLPVHRPHHAWRRLRLRSRLPPARRRRRRRVDELGCVFVPELLADRQPVDLGEPRPRARLRLHLWTLLPVPARGFLRPRAGQRPGQPHRLRLSAGGGRRHRRHAPEAVARSRRHHRVPAADARARRRQPFPERRRSLPARSAAGVSRAARLRARRGLRRRADGAAPPEPAQGRPVSGRGRALLGSQRQRGRLHPVRRRPAAVRARC